jgi:hypothetical protein
MKSFQQHMQYMGQLLQIAYIIKKNHENIGPVLDILRFICYHKKARRRGRRIMVITRACQA